MLAPSRCTFETNAPLFYPYGNTRFRNVLDDFNVELRGDDNTIKVNLPTSIYVLNHLTLVTSLTNCSQ